MAKIIVREVLSKKDLHEFIYLPSKIHKNHPGWLPPIYADEKHLFNKEKNLSYKYADAVFYLAYKNDVPAGRIMGLVNNRYNSIKNEKHGRFCFMECINDQEVVHALLTKVEEWAKEKGMIKIVGPLGFSDKDPQGFQIEGFEYPYIFTAATNFPYLPGLMEPEGYTKEVDLINYNIPIPDELPSLYQKAYARLTRNGDYELIEFTSKKQIKPFIIPVLELMNQTFSEIYGFVPLNDVEKVEFANRYLPVIDPAFVKLVRSGGKLVGFVIALPDLTSGIIAARGKLFPFGIYRIMKEMKKSKKLMLMLGGVEKEYRGKGIDVLMAVTLLNSAKQSKMERIDSHLILENNNRMRAECIRFSGKVERRFRIYQKDLKT
jgi:hypothetical protein